MWNFEKVRSVEFCTICTSHSRKRHFWALGIRKQALIEIGILRAFQISMIHLK